MFGSWPGPVPAPSPGPHPHPHSPNKQLRLTVCTAGDKQQQFMAKGNALGLVDDVDSHGYHTCVDVGGCGDQSGSSVHLFSNPDGCGNSTHGNPCQAKNEQWKLSGGLIQSVLNDKLCIKASSADGAVLACRT